MYKHTHTIPYEPRRLLKGFSFKNRGFGALFCILSLCDIDDRNTMYIMWKYSCDFISVLDEWVKLDRVTFIINYYIWICSSYTHFCAWGGPLWASRMFKGWPDSSVTQTLAYGCNKVQYSCPNNTISLFLWGLILHCLGKFTSQLWIPLQHPFNTSHFRHVYITIL